MKKVLFIQDLFIFIDMTKEKRENIKASAWLNLFVGLYNMYLYSQGEWWFNFLIGSLCIGAWVFFRKV